MYSISPDARLSLYQMVFLTVFTVGPNPQTFRSLFAALKAGCWSYGELHTRQLVERLVLKGYLASEIKDGEFLLSRGPRWTVIVEAYGFPRDADDRSISVKLEERLRYYGLYIGFTPSIERQSLAA